MLLLAPLRARRRPEWARDAASGLSQRVTWTTTPTGHTRSQPIIMRMHSFRRTEAAFGGGGGALAALLFNLGHTQFSSAFISHTQDDGDDAVTGGSNFLAFHRAVFGLRALGIRREVYAGPGVRAHAAGSRKGRAWRVRVLMAQAAGSRVRSGRKRLGRVCICGCTLLNSRPAILATCLPAPASRERARPWDQLA